MGRLDIEKQNKLEPKRIEYALTQLHQFGIIANLIEKEKCIEFLFKGEKVKFYPYSGWHTGKSIKDGRGIEKLLDQIKQ